MQPQNYEAGAHLLFADPDDLDDTCLKQDFGVVSQFDQAHEKYPRGVLASILETAGPVSYERVKENLGVSRTNEISSAATTLEEFGVSTKEERDDVTYVDLNLDGINEIRERAASRRRTEEIMEDL